eukprot:Selendium_serpulae@DN2291_c0_g1_i2.p1
MAEWLSRRNSYIHETAHERRLAGHERRLRLRQYKKLEQAANVDRKVHVKLDEYRGLDDLVVSAHRKFKEYRQFDYERAGDAANLSALRHQAQIQNAGLDPLQGFENRYDED